MCCWGFSVCRWPSAGTQGGTSRGARAGVSPAQRAQEGPQERWAVPGSRARAQCQSRRVCSRWGFPWSCCSASALPGLVGSGFFAPMVLRSEQSLESLNKAVIGRKCKENLVMAC